MTSHGKGQNIDHTRQRLPSLSFDKHTKDVDLPSEIRWTAVGRQLSDRPIPSMRRHLDVGLSSPKQPPLSKPELLPSHSFSSSSSESDDNIKQDRGKADVTLMHKHSSLGANSMSFVSSRVLDKFDTPPSSTNEILRAVSVDSKERKGLSALKAMSSERRKWDTLDGKLDIGPSPLFDDCGSQGDTSFNYRRSEKDIKPLVKQSLTQSHLSSTPVDERRATDLLYGIPYYRRHNIGGIEPPKEAPPPIPSTPPPYEAVGLTWRSAQSSKKQELQGTRSYLQQSRNTKESDPQNLAVSFDSSNVNISEV
ncbi:uncharacterized protein LOC131977776 [Centropristis striata]|uniref:uncharacterized protein LOC131977776 n=1 Tax=Centropristis striata TaxID=184440 RepID=UPI0027DFB0D5|nr:uncharacterized protein LOC131977776 [Centropristis striata]